MLVLHASKKVSYYGGQFNTVDEHGTAHLSVVGPNLICPFIFLLHQKKRLGTLVCSITFVALLVGVF